MEFQPIKIPHGLPVNSDNKNPSSQIDFQEILSRPCRQLIVEVALASMNFNILEYAQQVLDALPMLVKNKDVRSTIEAIIRFGLGQQDEAMKIVQEATNPEAKALQEVFVKTIKDVEALQNNNDTQF